MSRTGGSVRFNFGASNVLARQIASGAPVDVFISADEGQMDVVAQAGMVLEGTRIDLLSTQLAIVTQAAARLRNCSRLCSTSNSMLRYRVASIHSS